MFCEIKNLSINLNKKNILKNISIKILSGKVTGIIGKNGSGKTTLLRCINCLVKGSRGTIKHSYKSPFPMLFQKPASFQNTVKYNFEILSKIKKINPEIKWFKSFQLEKIKMKKMNEISGGEQQKVFLSRVMSIETNVIIMDEPNQYLDEQSDKKLINLLKEEKKKKKTIVLVSHDINFIRTLADRIINLDNGKIIFNGNTKSFFK